jgi:hypothetical protein
MQKESLRQRAQLNQLDAAACFALAIIVGGVTGWISFMAAEQKMRSGARDLFAEEINCMRLILHVLSDDASKELLIDGLRNELREAETDFKSLYGISASEARQTRR